MPGGAKKKSATKSQKWVPSGYLEKDLAALGDVVRKLYLRLRWHERKHGKMGKTNYAQAWKGGSDETPPAPKWPPS